MENILEKISAYAKMRVREYEKIISSDEIKRMANKNVDFSFPFLDAIKKPNLSFICECKKASPSKGLIEPDFDYLKIAKEYENAGADAISVLTEPKWFLGDDRYLSEISSAVSLPCLRKDFVVSSYMIYQAKVLGASAVLLICSVLGKRDMKEFVKIAESIGLSTLCEVHDEKETEIALSCGAKIIGVNNRNLKDFSVDNTISGKLRRVIPSDVAFVSESGVKTREDVKKIEEMGADAVLIGETLMRAVDKKAKLLELKND